MASALQKTKTGNRRMSKKFRGNEVRTNKQGRWQTNRLGQRGRTARKL